MTRIIHALPLLLLAVAPLSPDVAEAGLRVVATTSDLGDLARLVGGDDVEVSVLCPGSTDPHYLSAKPSLARKLGKADLLVYNGLELEIGWLPRLIRKARNPKVRPGGDGELDCSSALTEVLGVPHDHVDRGHGDIHAQGNPHYTLDPRAMVRVARHMAARMGELDPDHAAAHAARADSFARVIRGRLAGWEADIAPARAGHVLLYHQTWAYLVHWLGLDVYGEIEHRPGITPSPRHVQEMIDRGRELGDVIVVAATWSHIDVARRAAHRMGAPLAVLPASTGAVDGVDSYLHLIDAIVKGLATAAAEGAGS